MITFSVICCYCIRLDFFFRCSYFLKFCVGLSLTFVEGLDSETDCSICRVNVSLTPQLFFILNLKFIFKLI
jgi:hypothetical protein